MKTIFEYCREKTQQRDASHDYAHHVAVQHDAMQIFEQFRLNKKNHRVFKVYTVQFLQQVVSLAAILHDVPDHKYCQGIQADNLMEEIRQLLISEGHGDKVDIIMDIIDNISFSKEVKGKLKDLGVLNVIRNIVSDADKIQALGAEGLERCKQFSKFKHPTYSENEIQMFVLGHCAEKLNHLIEYIYTDEGKKLAQPKQDYIISWYNQNMAKYT